MNEEGCCFLYLYMLCRFQNEAIEAEERRREKEEAAEKKAEEEARLNYKRREAEKKAKKKADGSFKVCHEFICGVGWCVRCKGGDLYPLVIHSMPP